MTYATNDPVSPAVRDYLAAAPKAELHVHLEGSIMPATLLELARRNDIELPASSVEGLQEWFKFRDFLHFIDNYATFCRCMVTSEDYDLVTYEFGVEMARQNVRYAEVTFSPSTHDFYGSPAGVYLVGLARGRERALRDFGVQIRWVFDIVRSVPDPARREYYADYTTSVAIEGMAHGVVALGLGGGEEGYPPEMFASHFERAIAAGLKSDPHAGEAAGPESVWSALRLLHAARIGHGVRSIEDPALVAHLAENAIPLEVSPTSNIRLGVYPGYEAHPLSKLYEAGVPLTVNSDDPPLFGTTLNNEVSLLPTAFGLSLEQTEDIILNGVRHSFLPAAERSALEAEFRAELAALRKAYFPAGV